MVELTQIYVDTLESFMDAPTKTLVTNLRQQKNTTISDIENLRQTGRHPGTEFQPLFDDLFATLGNTQTSIETQYELVAVVAFAEAIPE